MILNLKYNEELTPEGMQITPAKALLDRGPIVQVVLQQLGGKGAHRAGYALVDTGAGHTCVDRAVAQEIGLPIVDTGRMSSATHHGEVVPIFAAQLDIHGVTGAGVPRAFGVNIRQSGIIALIGRDVLGSMVMIYNGPGGGFTLTA